MEDIFTYRTSTWLDCSCALKGGLQGQTSGLNPWIHVLSSYINAMEEVMMIQVRDDVKPA